jgi:hypothetical protein
MESILWKVFYECTLATFIIISGPATALKTK